MPSHLRTSLITAGFLLASLAALVSDASARCGDFNEDGRVTAVDALGVLSAATGTALCDPYHCDIDGSGSISATDALRTLRIAIGQSTQENCPRDPDLCLNDREFFFRRIWTPILSDCVICHSPDGAAADTDLILQGESEDGYLDYNFSILKNLSVNKAELLLSKPLGIAHGGGQRLDMTEESLLYADLRELLRRFDEPLSNCRSSGDFWAGLGHLSSLEVLRKAAMLLAGRRPTPSEEDKAEFGGAQGLREAIRQTMEGAAFDAFLMEAANDRLLTDKYLGRAASAFGVLQGEYQYPDLYRRINQIEAILGEEAARDARDRTNAALAREPLQLIVFIANNERPYTEVVTADYIMVNPWSDPVYQAHTGIADKWDDNIWRQGRNRGYHLPDYPHAGVLTSPMFLARFPSTATNRNRARARWVYRFFLGVDIEALAVRTVDPSALADTDNPTMNNPACTQCHTVNDPVAATFQNFGDDGIYLEHDTDSLPSSYKRGELYERGDRWYRDVLPPGFAGMAMPAAQTDSSLPWLGAQIAADPRFARGAVEFWYQGLFGRSPLQRPTNPADSDYQARLTAFLAEDEVFSDISDQFRFGSAGTAEHGPFNLKDLLVELALSPLFSVTAADTAQIRDSAELDALGLFHLLTPEQLNRKFESSTGQRWARPSDRENPDLLGRYRLFYGGIDSAGIIKRAEELNALMATVPQRMAYEMACPIAVSEFSLPPQQRILLPLVEPGDLPEDPQGAARIRSNIAWLHSWLLGEDLESDDAEVERTFRLFGNIRAQRVLNNKPTDLRRGAGHCQLDFGSGAYIETDEHHTIRAWTAVLAYLLSDYRFIYE